MRLVLLGIALFAALLPGLRVFRNSLLPAPDKNERPPYTNDVAGCGPSAAAPIRFNGERRMVPLPGWGSHTWKVAAANDSALFYFNQGLNLFYSFHTDEALSSFTEAQRHDPNCAMAYWGQAMASGPIINAPDYGFNNPAVVEALSKGEALAGDPLEKALIKAQQLRFTADKKAKPQQLAQAYRDAMQQLYAQYSGHPEVAVLYADALMMIHPRNWYEPDGKEKEGTAEIVKTLALILKHAPDHPAALHYYIHMVEPSQHPERARQAADRLMPLMPAVTHMVHMPSHIYIRTGDYRKGIESNRMAVKGYNTYQQVLNRWEGNRYLYFHHNVDMQGASASLMGDYTEAAKAYGLVLSQFRPSDSAFFQTPAFSNVVQFNTAQLYLLQVRFGRWQQLLQSKAPLTHRTYHRLLWAFGQGMALAKTGKPEAAAQQLAYMKKLMKDFSLFVQRPNRNRAIDPATVAALLLEGTISQAQQQPDTAAARFEAAVRAEDALRYAEPEDWRLPARQFLAQLHLEQRDYAKAKAVLEADLADHPNNYWALNGMYAVLTAQGKKAEAATWRKAHAAILSQGDGRLKGVMY